MVLKRFLGVRRDDIGVKRVGEKMGCISQRESVSLDMTERGSDGVVSPLGMPLEALVAMSAPFVMLILLLLLLLSLVTL